MNAIVLADELTERLIKGRDTWWFLGPGGVARIDAKHVMPDGRLQPAARDKLRELGLYTPVPFGSYSLTVLTSTDCNLGCGYCFQNTGQDLAGGNRPPRIEHARLTSQTITSILEFGRRQMAAVGLDELRIMLFGGEPLLNPRGCVELLERAAGYGLKSAQMISNLTLLTPALAGKLSDLGLASVQVTFDGDRADHDRIRARRSPGRTGTFDTIIRNMERASLVSPLHWILRVNVSHHTEDGTGALVDRLAAALDPARCSLYFARIVDAEVGYVNDLAHTAEVAGRFGEWQRQAIGLGFGVPRPGPDPICQTCTYRGGRYGAVISADGTLSSCWDTAGKPDWQVGTITGGYFPDAEISGRWTGCAELFPQGPDADAVTAFNDLVDAALLDYLSDTGRL